MLTTRVTPTPFLVIYANFPLITNVGENKVIRLYNSRTREAIKALQPNPRGRLDLKPKQELFFLFYFILFYFIITLGIHLQYSYTVLTYNKTTKFTYVTALLLTCLLLTYIKIPKTSLQQTKGLLKTINK